MTENTYGEFLAEVRKRIADEAPHIRENTLNHILKILDETAREYVPVGNLPIFPVHDYYEGFDPKIDCEKLSHAVINGDTFAWDGKI